MKLTDIESKVEFDIDPAVIVAVFDRRGYTEVRTAANDIFAECGKYKVLEPVPVILDRLNKERCR